MKTKFFGNLVFVLSALALITIAYSCKSDDVTAIVLPDANTISGTVTFADTMFGSIAVGYYDVAAFSSWPPTGAPSANDSLRITKVGSKYQATYKIKGLANGQYAVAIGWRRLTGGASPVMGIYSTDTAHYPANPNTLNPTKISIVNNAGVENNNVLSWADTTKRIF